jgi:hypothetical protein
VGHVHARKGWRLTRRCSGRGFAPPLNGSIVGQLAPVISESNTMTPSSRAEAMRLLADVGAPPRFLRHAELVGEAAEDLLAGLAKLNIPLDGEFVRVGVVLHDAGKAVHRDELDSPGSSHEPTGERLLLQRGATDDVARVCRSHAQWRDVAETFEELVIALADKLWKGARVTELEELVIDRAAATAGRDRWELFTHLDAVFERVAAGADGRLARSSV